MFERFVKRRAEEALSDTPAVLIVGPRRAGKTTLVRQMETAGRRYITLDDQTALAAARSDPVGFIRGLDNATIDEIQRAPDLLLSIKKAIDDDYRPGRFLQDRRQRSAMIWFNWFCSGDFQKSSAATANGGGRTGHGLISHRS
ncbi:hypothetical protein GCM10011505_40100 [Tistrella bauzanensis]|uniref:AAA domain-containing protein n=1 Tax=Tistrella bauzanensis TaxID=657419 RepID=A0ABQ1IXU0_9PROT|nr:hypothetical protein GCM10011505_40100 [Tistrella bauzanensis]